MDRILKERPSREYLKAQQTKQDRINFHSGLEVDSAYYEFLRFVRSILIKDKFEAFMSLMVVPAETVRVTNEISKALRKVFDGKDKLVEVNFVDTSIREDFGDFMEDFDLELFMFDLMKTGIGSYVVVDLSKEQNGSPMPYYFSLGPNEIYDVGEDHIVFIQDNIMYAYDDESYSWFSYEDGSLGQLLGENKHDLGYCPKVKSWKGRSPLEDYLGDLQWLLFFGISKKYADLYSAYAVYWGFAEECDYDNVTEYCDGGHLKRASEESMDSFMFDNKGGLVPCPKCKNKITGVGSFVEVDMPEEGMPNITPPVGKINVDHHALKYNVDEVARLTERVITGVTGGDSKPITHTAVNKDQIMSLFESKKTILNDLKGNFERVHEFLISTMAKLRYGDYYLNSTVKYGRDFYLYTDTDLAEMYAKAIEDGMDTIILDYLQDEYINTKYRYDEKGHRRATMLKNLETFRHTTKSQMLEMFENGLIDRKQYLLNTNLSTYVLRFERENVPIIEFGKNLEYSERVQTILTALKGYIEDIIILKPAKNEGIKE